MSVKCIHVSFVGDNVTEGEKDIYIERERESEREIYLVSKPHPYSYPNYSAVVFCAHGRGLKRCGVIYFQPITLALLP